MQISERERESEKALGQAGKKKRSEYELEHRPHPSNLTIVLNQFLPSLMYLLVCLFVVVVVIFLSKGVSQWLSALEPERNNSSHVQDQN